MRENENEKERERMRMKKREREREREREDFSEDGNTSLFTPFSDMKLLHCTSQ